MREIKFRAWQKHRKEMFEVSAIQFRFPGKPDFVVKKSESGLNTETWTLDEVELMQYTELVDRTGKTICEGDILRWFFDGEQILYVEWEYNYFKLVEVRNKDANVLVADKRTLEIIGNIYEHPELVQ